MTRTFPYTCPICGKPGQVEIMDWPDENSPVRDTVQLCVDKLLPIVGDDGCGDYTKAINNCETDLYRATRKLIGARTSYLPGSQQLCDIELAIRKIVTAITTRYATAVSRYRHKPMAWEPAWVDDIMEQPSKGLILLRSYNRVIEQLEMIT